MSNNPDDLYAETFGPDAKNQKEHEKNYSCTIAMSQKMSDLVDSLLDRLIKALAIRAESYTDSIEGTFDEKFNNQRKARQANFTYGQTDAVTSDKYSDDFDYLPEMGAAGPLPESSEDPLVRFSDLPANPDDSFALLQNKRAIRSSPDEGTHSTPSSTLSRQERASSGASVAAISIGLANLALTSSSALYLNSRIEKVGYAVKQMVEALMNFEKWSGKMRGNVQLVKNEFSEAAVRMDSLYNALSRLGEEHACTKLATSFLTDLSALASTFDSLYDSLIQGIISPKVISIDTLQSLMDQSLFFKDMLVTRYPLSFYGQSTLSLLSVDKEKQVIRILIATPRVSATASYHRVSLLTATTSIELDGKFYDKEILFPNTEVAIPIEISKQYGFKLEKMNKEQISQLRVPIDCGKFQKVEFCKDFVPLSHSEELCLEGLLHDKEELYHHCHFRMVRREKHTPWAITKSISGSLLSTGSDVDVYALDRSKPPGLQEVFLTNGRFGSTNRGICLFISSVFSALKLVGRGTSFHQNLTLSQNTEMTYTSDLATSSSQFSIEHYRWYETETSNFSMERMEKFVDVDHRMGLADMDLEPVHIDFSDWSWSLISILVVASTSAVALLYMGLFCRFGRRWFPGCRRNRATRDEGNVDVEAALPDRVREALPRPPNPPYARFNQDGGSPNIVINTGSGRANRGAAERQRLRRQNEIVRILARAALSPPVPASDPPVAPHPRVQEIDEQSPPSVDNRVVVAAPVGANE